MTQSIFSLTDHEVFLVTASDGAKLGGFIATWILPASLIPGPPRVLLLVAPENATWDIIQSSQTFAIHLLSEDQADLIPKFGLDSSRDRDKFVRVDYDMIDTLPIVKGCCGYSLCRLDTAFDIGERQIVLGLPYKHVVVENKKPLKKKTAFSQFNPEILQKLLAKQQSMAAAAADSYGSALLRHHTDP